MINVAELFQALGDPIRLGMIQRLSEAAPQTITSVSRGLSITRQGARKHLQVLADSHVIIMESKGRDTLITLNKDTLEIGKAFIAELERRWDKRLEALRQFVEADV